MKRRLAFPKARIAIGAVFALLAVIVVTLSVNRYRTPQGAPPEALAHIAERNHEAAMIAAARQRADSAASTNAAEDLAEARRRGDAQANATIASFPNDDNRLDAAAR